MPTPETVVVHPLVLLSVVDHYNRVARDTRKRVVGVLLGEASRGTVQVTNAFGGALRRLQGLQRQRLRAQGRARGAPVCCVACAAPWQCCARQMRGTAVTAWSAGGCAQCPLRRMSGMPRSGSWTIAT